MKQKLILLIIFLLSLDYTGLAHQTEMDSLKNELENARSENNDAGRVIYILNELAIINISKSPILALNYCFDAIEYSIKMNESREIVQVYGTLGTIYMEQGLYDQAMEFHTKSLLHFMKHQEFIGYAWSLINIGNIYYAKNDFEKAKKQYVKALKYFIDNKNDFGKATVFNNLGMIFNEKIECDSSLFYFNKVLDLRNQQGDLKNIALSYRYIGNAHKTCKNFEKSRYFFKKALSIYQKIDENYGAAQLLLFIGDLDSDYFDVEDAIINYIHAIEIYEKEKEISGIVMSLNRMANLYFKQGKYQDCILFAKRSLEIGKQNGLLLEQLESLFFLYNSKSLLNNHKDAYSFLLEYNSIKDSISNDKVNQRILKQEFILFSNEYEKDKEIQLREIEMLEKDSQIKSLILRKRNNLIYFSLLSTIILLVLFLGSFRSFSQKARIIKEISLGAPLFSKTLVVFLSGIYFISFAFLFQPFGLYELSMVDKAIVFGGFGIIAMLIVFLTFSFFSILERFVKNEKWDVVKCFLFVAIIILGISFSAWFCAKICKIDELVFMTWFDILILVMSLVIILILIIIIFIKRILFKRQIKIAEVPSRDSEQSEKPFKNHIIILKAEKTKDELSFLLSEFICVEAKGNYSEIFYLQSNIPKRSMMLISMKVIEEQLQEFESIVRCHKSYIVNSSKIEKLFGNSQGYKLVIKNLHFEVPVSRNFSKERLEKLMKKKSYYQT